MIKEQTYIELKPELKSLAYRFLGSMVEAEDIVQEAFISLDAATKGPNSEQIRNLKAYLRKIVSNRCIDLLKSASKQRETYIGPWLPEPMISDGSRQNDLLSSYLFKEKISTAYMVLLHQLNWTERVVFILREVLQYDYEEIGEIVEKSSTNCRQIFKRAKKSIEDRSVKEIDSPSKADVLVEKFVMALSIGDLSQLLEVLSSEAVLYLDGGGKVKAPKLPIFGSDRISRFFMSILPDLSASLIIKACQINAHPGMMAYEGEKVVSTAAFHIQDNRIIHIYFVANPEKLEHLSP
jgi:RNA polymerase sigma factor (sigma-70 family)